MLLGVLSAAVGNAIRICCPRQQGLERPAPRPTASSKRKTIILCVSRQLEHLAGQSPDAAWLAEKASSASFSPVPIMRWAGSGRAFRATFEVKGAKVGRSVRAARHQHYAPYLSQIKKSRAGSHLCLLMPARCRAFRAAICARSGCAVDQARRLTVIWSRKCWSPKAMRLSAVQSGINWALDPDTPKTVTSRVSQAHQRNRDG